MSSEYDDIEVLLNEDNISNEDQDFRLSELS